ncbi:MAG TPA: CHAT domain-containing tetratricopeptide repeat protein [Kofleriaceae bacterium]|nr:CHAT domain-containing tetratricopeptide repeat protein [Kofleriaceae bacterium]
MVSRIQTSSRRLEVLVLVVLFLGCSRTESQWSTAEPKEPSDEATSLDKQVETLYSQGQYREALPLAERSLALREKVLGARHPDVAKSLNNLASLYQAQGTYARAEPLFVRALDIYEKALGAVHSDVAESLNNLALLYQAQGEYGRAEPLHVRALAIREKALGAMHPDVATSLNNLALLYYEQGTYARAEPLFVRALDIYEKALDAMHPDVATSLSNLALLYYAQGAYTRAEPLWVRALAISEMALGARHPLVAISLNNLASLYQAQGTYARAEPLFVRALDIYEKALGARHPLVALSLNNLAEMYLEQGALARAEPLFVRALDIREKALGAMHPDVAQSLNNLAGLYLEQGALARAEPLFVRALDIREKALGAMHPDVAFSLNNLASLYYEQGAFARVEPLFVRALHVREKTLGAIHPDVASSLNNLAKLYYAQGAYTRAEPLFVRALDISEKALGVMHPDVAQSLNNLAKLYQAQSAYARAEPLLVRASEIHEAYLRIELVRLSEARKRGLLSLLQLDTQTLVSFHAHDVPASLRALEAASTAVLRRKGRVLDALVETQASLRAHLTPQLRDKLAQLADATTQLSTRLRAPFDAKTARNQQDEIKELRTQIDTLEGELNAASGLFHAHSEPVTLAKLQAALPPGAALVEFVHYHHFDARQTQQLWQEARYLAYLLFRQGPPQWVPLGEAGPIDAAVDAVRAAMRKDVSAEAARRALRNLDAKLLAPIRSRLPSVSHLIISPDDKLNLVPFEALIDPQGRPALEQYLISYLTSGRDLLRLAVKQAAQSPATIVADPEYGPGPYARLAGTVAEADAIVRHFPGIQTLSRSQATKAALARLAGPAVLHVATHGFFNRVGGLAPAATTTPAGTQRSPAAAERGMSIESALSAPPPGSANDDPTEALDQAGLALAGANVRPDGIVSARELAGMDWWGTQLVVLSACQTGVGAVKSGEGVYGLRRALVLAGAQSQVVSLWNVSDSSAPELMREFYGELARGTGRAEALRRAKLRLMRQPRFAHPYYWAAFIPAGDWTPLATGTMRQQEAR